ERCQVELLAEGVTPPTALLPPGTRPGPYLRELCEAALPRLYPRDDEAARRQFEHELAVVDSLDLCEFFLVVREVVEHARNRGIRCAGRGSAANSILAYLLGITSVDPLAHNLLFERFLHRGRKGMPDIDVDFDSERRDEVIAWMEERFGVEHSAMTATLITYQVKSAVREMLKVLGCDLEAIDHTGRLVSHWDDLDSLRQRRGELAASLGVSLESPLLSVLFSLVERVVGCPRHLGLHNGGMVLSRPPLSSFSPVQTSAGGVRELQFDKDDVEALGLIKFDVLGLRMLAVLSEAEAMQPGLDLERLSLDDEPTFELIRSGKTLSLFQIESPGQMSLLSRTQPRHFRDLVAQVALFRPGPLQGGMVHPYVDRRLGRAPVTYPHPCLEPILADTCGIILFQEQVLEICHQFAGMSLEEADEFRRLMSRWRDPGCMREMGESFVRQAMERHAVPRELASEVFRQVSAFVGYGFCRSHAAAFARTVYHSAYLKAHHPAAYMAAVLEHHPGFFPLSTILEEARRLGVGVLPVDAWKSQVRWSLENSALRVPLTRVQGMSPAAAASLAEARQGCSSLEALLAAVDLPVDLWESLSRAGAFDSLMTRREALWRVGLFRTDRSRTSRSLPRAGPEIRPASP
ncbi:MAG: DNA polymerase III subunit alpha, partial [Candidatus Eremiobacterota bacterium]